MFSQFKFYKLFKKALSRKYKKACHLKLVMSGPLTLLSMAAPVQNSHLKSESGEPSCSMEIIKEGIIAGN